MARRLLVIWSVWAALHGYVGERLLAHAPVGLAGRVAGWAAIALLAVAPLAAFAALWSRRAPERPGAAALEWVGFTGVGLSSLLIVFVVAADVLHVRAWLGPGGFAAGVVGAALAVLLAGVWRARRPGVVRVRVPIARLPPDLEGLRIVQLSDLHVGPTLKRNFVERVVRITNDLAPDLVALTGDVADGFPRALRDEVAPLADLSAPLGKYFVTGNHEYYWDAAGWMRELERLGFRVLANAHQMLQRGSGRLLLAGVTDPSGTRQDPGRGSDAARAVSGAPASDVRVLLAHQPRSAYAARTLGFDLQLSGHTHGG
ncbi:MAG TPA: metallophosphoesterase, partial [Gemmatimonadales bacterium]|nr:metallophosphoesterase [Gemmatimonadales bacterium]